MAYFPNASALTGVTTDGQGNMTVAGGVTIDGALVAGNPNAAVTPSQHHLWGQTTVEDTPANMANNWDVLVIAQNVPVDTNGGGSAVTVQRQGVLGGNDYVAPMSLLQSSSGSAQPTMLVAGSGAIVLEAIKSLTGALSAVTDPAAKAVLTSLVAMATGIKVATDDTT